MSSGDRLASDAETSGVPVLCVIPRFVSGDLDGFSLRVRQLEENGFNPLVVATSAGALLACQEQALPYVCFHENSGFAWCINRAVRSVDEHWKWLLILNDDLELSDRLPELHSELFEYDRDKIGVVYLDGEASRRIPGRLQIFGNVSLITAAWKKYIPAMRGERRPIFSFSSRGWYKSFSAVAISAEVWREVGTLDETMPFTFEDADYIRRVIDRGFGCRTVPRQYFEHRHSVTSSIYSDRVLPVCVFSAYKYAAKWSRGTSDRLLLTRASLAAALLIRTLLVTTRPDRVKQWRGSRKSIQVLLSTTRPELPTFEGV